MQRLRTIDPAACGHLARGGVGFFVRAVSEAVADAHAYGSNVLSGFRVGGPA